MFANAPCFQVGGPQTDNHTAPLLCVIGLRYEHQKSHGAERPGCGS